MSPTIQACSESTLAGWWERSGKCPWLEKLIGRIAGDTRWRVRVLAAADEHFQMRG
jgi:hypothetical protein